MIFKTFAERSLRLGIVADTFCPCVVSAGLDLKGRLQLHRPHAVVLRPVNVQAQRGQPAGCARSARFQQQLRAVLLRAPAGEELTA